MHAVSLHWINFLVQKRNSKKVKIKKNDQNFNIFTCISHKFLIWCNNVMHSLHVRFVDFRAQLKQYRVHRKMNIHWCAMEEKSCCVNNVICRIRIMNIDRNGFVVSIVWPFVDDSLILFFLFFVFVTCVVFFSYLVRRWFTPWCILKFDSLRAIVLSVVFCGTCWQSICLDFLSYYYVEIASLVFLHSFHFISNSYAYDQCVLCPVKYV